MTDEFFINSVSFVSVPIPVPPSSTYNTLPYPFQESRLLLCSLVNQGNEFIISLKLFVDLYRGGR